MIKVLFVCLGNICRSPMAEGIFKKLLDDHGLKNSVFCDSAGTSGYHVGSPPDERMMKVAVEKSIKLNHTGRQIMAKDLEKFDYILAMDENNFKEIKRLNPDNNTSKILMMRDFDNEKESINVPDPYYGGKEGFENVFRILFRSNVAFLEYLKNQHRL